MKCLNISNFFFLFSDMNNIKVVGTIANEFATAFGFTEDEVFAALDAHGYTEKALVKLRERLTLP